VIFISIHSVIIYVVFFGAYMRCIGLCPLNSGVIGLNPNADGRRVEDTGRSCLTSRISCSDIYNIEHKLYICIYDFFVK
jgi:hypothetical protein